MFLDEKRCVKLLDTLVVEVEDLKHSRVDGRLLEEIRLKCAFGLKVTRMVQPIFSYDR